MSLRPLVAVALLLAGCGSSVCQRWGNLEQKNAACALTNRSFNASLCETASKNACSQGDLDTVSKYLDCMDQTPACTPANRSSVQGQYNTCLLTSNVASVGGTCLSAFTQ